MSTPVVVATRVVNQAMRLQIPQGLTAGDTFIVTPDTGRVFTVIVPENAMPGSYIEVIVPDEVRSESVNADGTPLTVNMSVQKTRAGAALAGALVGTLLLGPIAGIILAGGAAYATTRPDGHIGHYAREIGENTYSHTAKAKNWIQKEFKKHYNSKSNAQTGSYSRN